MCISYNRRLLPTDCSIKSTGAIVMASPSNTSASSLSSPDLKGSLLFDTTTQTNTKKKSNSSNTHTPQQQHHAHIVVQHKHYEDHSRDSPVQYPHDLPARGGVTTPFPIKLHELLDATERDGLSHIISWAPHGRCVVIHKPKELVAILPTYFNGLSKLASFQRQLNLYGFQRLSRGRDRGGYYHELFLRGRVFLANNIQRQKVKGTGVRPRSNPDQEPNFWSMPFVDAAPAIQGQGKQQQDTAVMKQSSSPKSLQQMVDLEQSISSFFANSNTTNINILKDDPSFNTSTWQFPSSALEPTPFPNFPNSAPITTTNNKNNDDMFGDKDFNSFDWDTFLNNSNNNINDDEDLLFNANEADAFFDDFDFPEESFLQETNLEDDDVFVDLLEQMIA